jgi:hypothetical protein
LSRATDLEVLGRVCAGMARDSLRRRAPKR